MADTDKDLKHRTIETYNLSAKALAEYFEGIGPRDGDIDLAFALAGDPRNAQVLEIGCGPGREVRDIMKHTPSYTGIDVSEGFLELAKVNAPKGVFELADALTYDYKGPYDIVFSFVALGHLDQAELTTVFQKVLAALKPHGVIYISLKYADKYQSIVKKDKYGERLFYLYSPQLIQKIAGPELRLVYESRNYIEQTDTEWCELALQKKA